MPKTVYFIRHAKSSWDNLGMKDHDRPLNKRGLRDGPVMAQKLFELEGALDQIITSTAVRAKETAAYFQKVSGVKSEHYHEDANLYHGDLSDYLQGVVTWADDDFDSAALFAHNPGMTYLANNYTDRFIDNIPTCGISKIVFEVDSFLDIDKPPMSKNQIVNILKDVHIAEALINGHHPSIMKDSLQRRYLAQVLEKWGATESEFELAMNHMHGDPDYMRDVYETVQDRVDEYSMKLDKEESFLDKKQNKKRN